MAVTFGDVEVMDHGYLVSGACAFFFSFLFAYF
jgi:hypothetical protein